MVGGIGVEGDGAYSLDRRPDLAATSRREEQAARAGQRGFEPPEIIRADQILADGIRLAYTDTRRRRRRGTARPGADRATVRARAASRRARTSSSAACAGQADPRFPTRGGPGARPRPT